MFTTDLLRRLRNDLPMSVTIAALGRRGPKAIASLRHCGIVSRSLDFGQLYTRMILLGSITFTEEKNHVQDQSRFHSPVLRRSP